MTTAQEKKHTHENLKFLEMSAHTMGGGRKKKNFQRKNGWPKMEKKIVLTNTRNVKNERLSSSSRQEPLGKRALSKAEGGGRLKRKDGDLATWRCQSASLHFSPLLFSLSGSGYIFNGTVCLPSQSSQTGSATRTSVKK